MKLIFLWSNTIIAFIHTRCTSFNPSPCPFQRCSFDDEARLAKATDRLANKTESNGGSSEKNDSIHRHSSTLSVVHLCVSPGTIKPFVVWLSSAATFLQKLKLHHRISLSFPLFLPSFCPFHRFEVSMATAHPLRLGPLVFPPLAEPTLKCDETLKAGLPRKGVRGRETRRPWREAREEEWKKWSAINGRRNGERRNNWKKIARARISKEDAARDGDPCRGPSCSDFFIPV